MSASHLECSLHHRLYRDSVTLMSLAAELQKMEGILEAGVVMATPSNLDILSRSNMLPEDLEAGPDDLLISVRGTDTDSIKAALKLADEKLTAEVNTKGSQSLDFEPKTIDEALKDSTPELATVSVPGVYAAPVIETALKRDLNVFCFSDNVSIEDEDRLKKLAHDRNLLLMGPDCGTAIIDQVPLGFANEISHGNVGIVSASGTGAQEVSTLIDRAGVGVSQLIGVGGRDLSGKVRWPATFVALEKLDSDPETKLIVVISKPPAKELVEKLKVVSKQLSKPLIACLLGEEDSNSIMTVRGTLEGAAIEIAAYFRKQLDFDAPHADIHVDGSKITGLYTGGTLAHEAEILCERAGVSYEILDLGDDQYTQGRPHPMISPDLRSEFIENLEDTDVLLVDLVIGWGSSSDPATPLTQAITKARDSGHDPVVLASITGTTKDHQGYQSQAEILRNAGIFVFPSNAAAVRCAIDLVSKE